MIAEQRNPLLLELIVMNQELLLRKKMASTWAGMIDRCYNPNAAAYYCYGARAINVCEQWQLSVDTFMADIGLPPTLQHSVDRIDCNGNYEPRNCRWATQEEQNNNTRRSKLITWNGKTQSIRDWAKEYNVGARGVSERLRRGWDLEKSLTTPGRMLFDEELADRRKRNHKEWQDKGKLYSAKSKQNRGQKLSSVEQAVIDKNAQEVALARQAAIDAMHREAALKRREDIEKQGQCEYEWFDL
jgi:hypothetical protein